MVDVDNAYLGYCLLLPYRQSDIQSANSSHFNCEKRNGHRTGEEGAQTEFFVHGMLIQNQ